MKTKRIKAEPIESAPTGVNAFRYEYVLPADAAEQVDEALEKAINRWLRAAINELRKAQKLAKDDIPEPPLEETQEDKDIAEAEHAWAATGDPRITHHANFVGGYLAALAHERAEVAKMLPPQCPEWDKKAYNVQCAHAIEAIRARCEGGGQ